MASRTAGVLGLVLWCGGRAATGGAPALELVSVSDAGVRGNAFSALEGVSADGRYVVFRSLSSNLVAGDVNGRQDVFLRDRALGTTRLVSASVSGTQGNQDSGLAAVSAEGRWVAFQTGANNLAPGDMNSASDIYLKDMMSGGVTLVSRFPSGSAAGLATSPGISDDGVWIVFSSQANSMVPEDFNFTEDIYLYNRLTGALRLVSVDTDGGAGNGQSLTPRISGDGSAVAFSSFAQNLVPGGSSDLQVFLAPVAPGPLELLTDGGDGQGANGFSVLTSVSTDGRYVGVSTTANDLVPSVDFDGLEDVYALDRNSGAWSLVSLDPGGNDIPAAVQGGSLSDGARLVVLQTTAQVVPEDTNLRRDVYVRDRISGVLAFFNLTPAGATGSGESQTGALARDGSACFFMSDSTNLLAPPTSGTYHVYASALAAPCPADLNGDGVVGSGDLAALLGSWGPGGGPADLTGDGSVGAADLAALLGSWGPCV